MATLTSTKIKNTYDALLKASDNDAIGSSAKQITDGLGNGTPLYISTTQIGIGVTPEATYDLHVYQNAKVGGNLTITGDLTVNGTTTTVDTDTLRVEDPLIEVARNNTSSDAVDIGIYGKYAPSGTTLYAGLFRDTGDDKFKLFKSLEEQPTTTVNTSGTGYAVATLVANVEGTLTGVIASTTTATTQSANDNSTKVATTAYVDSSAGNYLPLAGGTMSGNIAMGSNNISGGGTFTATTFSGQLDGTISSTTTATTQTQGDNSTKVATTAYVDSIVTAQDLDFAGDSGTGAVDLDSQTFTIAGTSNEIETSASGQTLTVGLPDDVTVTGNLTVNGTGISLSNATNPTITVTDSTNGHYLTMQGLDGASKIDYLSTLIFEYGAGNTEAARLTSSGLTITEELTVSGTGQSSFAGQVTVPVTPSASTDAASKGYVDSQVGANNELSEVLANGNTTGGTDIAVSANDDITFTDSSKAIFGDDSDLEIYHDGSKSVIADVGTGALRIAGTNFELRNADQSKFYMNATDGGAINLYYDNSKKLETTNTGINVTGGITGDDSVFIEGNTNPNFTAHDITNETYTSLWSGDTEAALTFNHSLFRITSSAYNFTGTDLVTITSGGNVGIGQSPSTAKLEVAGEARVYTGSSLGYWGVDAGNSYVYFGTNTSNYSLSFQTNGSERMRIDSSGNVGIGITSTPPSPLTVVGTGVGASGTIGIQGANAHVGFKNSSGTFRSWVGHFNAATHGSDADLNLKTGYGTTGNIRFSADGDTTPAQIFLQGSTGNVGIGTTSPTTISSGYTSITTNGTNGGGLVMQVNGTATGYVYAESGALVFTNTSGVIQFYNTGSERVRITSDGHTKIADEKILGLRTSSNDYAIQYRDLDFRLIGSADGTTQRKFSFGYYTSDNPAGTWNGKVYINSYTGDVGIGTTSIDASSPKLEVSGSIMSTSSSLTAAPTTASIVMDYHSSDNTGRIMAGSGGSWNKNLSLVPYGGNVGIGTASPSYPLDVATSGNLLGRFASSSTASELNITSPTVNVVKIDTGSSDALAFATAGTERMRIDSSGNVKFNSWIRGTSDTNMLYSSTGLGLLLQAPSNSGTGGNIYFRNANGTVFHTFSQVDGSATFAGTASVKLTLSGGTTQNGIQFNGVSSDNFYLFSGNYAGYLGFGLWNATDSRMDMWVDGTGNIGIGTTSPAQPLSVHGNFLVRTTNADGNKNRMQCIVGGSSDAANLYLYYGNSGDGTVSVRLNAQGDSYLNGGNVGIGTTSLNTYDKLQVIGNAYIGGNATRGVRIADGGTYASIVGINQAVTAYTGLELRASGTNGQLFLDTSGNVGIGQTSTPTKTLSVNGEILQKTRLNLQRGSSGATTLIQFLNEVGTDRAHIDFGGTNEELSFFAGAGSTEHMRINSLGRVDIGTRSYVGSATSTTRLYLEGNTSGHNLGQFQMADFSGGFMFYLSSSSPSTNQSHQFYNNRIDSSPSVVGSIAINSTTTSFNTTGSDERSKKNIEDWNDSVLSKFKSLQPKKFHFNFQEDTEDKDLGFIAQNEVDNFPEAYPLTDDDGDGEYRYKFNPSGMVVYLMKAIKEQQEIISDLKSRIEILENN